MTPDDKDSARTFAELHEQSLRHLGRRLFAEARQQSESEDAEFETWKRERRKAQGRSESSGFLGDWGDWDGGDGGGSD